MFPFMIAEWKRWRLRSSRRTAGALVVALVFASLFHYLQPYLLVLAITAFSILIGWTSGYRYRPGRASRYILDGSKLGGLEFVIARIALSTAMWLYLLALATPPLVLAISLWEVGADRLISCLLPWFAATLLATGLGLLGSLLEKRDGPAIGLVLLPLWLLIVLLAPGARLVEPFSMAWALFRRPAALGEGISIAQRAVLGSSLELGLAIAAFVLAALALRRNRRRSDA